MELNCKHNRNPSITKIIEHAQLQCKDSLTLHVIKFVQITGFQKIQKLICGI